MGCCPQLSHQWPTGARVPGRRGAKAFTAGVYPAALPPKTNAPAAVVAAGAVVIRGGVSCGLLVLEQRTSIQGRVVHEILVDSLLLLVAGMTQSAPDVSNLSSSVFVSPAPTT